MIRHTPYSPYEFRNDTQAQDNEIRSMFKASQKAMDKEAELKDRVDSLTEAFIRLLSDFQAERATLHPETIEALRERLNAFDQPQIEIIEDYLKTY